jgi:segregation and condensation protein A
MQIDREVLSVRERMTLVMEKLNGETFTRFEDLFDFSEGKMGVVVTFIAILELIKDQLATLVQNEPFAPIHVKAVV